MVVWEVQWRCQVLGGQDEEDEDVAKGPELAGEKKEVGVRCDWMSEKGDGANGGSRREKSEDHLMRDISSASGKSVELESRVEDSVNGLGMVDGMGISAHNNYNEDLLAQEKEGSGVDKLRPQNSNSGPYLAQSSSGSFAQEVNGIR